MKHLKEGLSKKQGAQDRHSRTKIAKDIMATR